jgi:hypothetical protein
VSKVSFPAKYPITLLITTTTPDNPKIALITPLTSSSQSLLFDVSAIIFCLAILNSLSVLARSNATFASSTAFADKAISASIFLSLLPNIPLIKFVAIGVSPPPSPAKAV